MTDMTRRKFLGGLLASLASVGCSPAKKVLTEAQKRQEVRLKLADKYDAYVMCEVNDTKPGQYSEVIDKIFEQSDKIIQMVWNDAKMPAINEGLDKALTQLKVGELYRKMFIRNYGAEVFSIQKGKETKRVLGWGEWQDKFQSQARVAHKISAAGYDKNGLVPRPESDVFWRYFNNGQGIWRRNVSGIDKKDISDAKEEAQEMLAQRLLKMRSKESLGK